MEFWKYIETNIINDHRLILLIVVKSCGSSPGRKGFKMAVSSDRSIKGSIGGGVMEHKLVEDARKLLEINSSKISLLKQDHQTKAGKEASGLLCSGNQTIAFFPLNKQHLPIVQDITVSIEQDEPGVFLISNKQFRFNKGEILSGEKQDQTQTIEDWNYTEQTGLPDRLFIFGAGHVGLALSQIFRTLDFRITIFDNREGLNTFEDNHFANVKKIINYKNIGQLIPEGENIYVVVMTFAHKNDEMIIHQLAAMKTKYLGMMGSTKKVKTIFDNLRKKGVSQKLLDKIDAPIGLEIASETPAEIAISIAAKIISVRRGN